jgi:hypothetical protein
MPVNNLLKSVDDAGDAVRNVLRLGYKPDPGIYSRLERAIQQMPENVRVQELPGLLKRYKDGVPGWELKETDLDSVIAGRDVIPRSELLARVKERSPVYTHGETVLGGRPQQTSEWFLSHSDLRAAPWMTDAQHIDNGDALRAKPDYQPHGESPLGRGVSHGKPRYEPYGQGGAEYTEILLTQPSVGGPGFGSHWQGGPAGAEAVAHARFDTHGDALRINELQSDLGIHNRRAREAMADFVEGQPIATQRPAPELPFPLEDSWSDLLIKRLALEAARQGHRAIEIASPRSIADKVGGNIDNYEHFYGKVVPGSLERLGRKMGGLTEDAAAPSEVTVNTPSAVRAEAADAMGSANAFMWQTRRKAPGMGADLMEDEYGEMVRKMTLMRKAGHGDDVLDRFLEQNYQAAYQAGVRSLTDGNMEIGRARKQAGLAVGELIARAKAQSALEASLPAFNPKGDASRRYIMSDEMRKRILTQGIGASLLAPIAAGAAAANDDAVNR